MRAITGLVLGAAVALVILGAIGPPRDQTR
jgi:hypothetical protein